MAVRLLNHVVVADLCLGKPALRSLSATVTVGEALTALKTFEDKYISVWSCKDHQNPNDGVCVCIGKVCMVDIICFLANEDNLSSPGEALASPLAVLLSPVPGIVKHVEPSSSLLDAIDLIIQGTQNLVVPIKTRFNKQLDVNSTTTHNGGEYCWLTQEDVIRFLLNSIGLFSPTPALTIESLGIISTGYMSVWYHSPASTAIEAISQSLAEQTSVGVVDSDGTLVGEISPFTLAGCDESVAAAITTLSTGDLMSYIDCGGPPEDMIMVVRKRLKEMNLEGMLEEFEIFSTNISSSNSNSNSSSEDEESSLPPPSPTTPFALFRPGRFSRSRSYSARMVRKGEAIVCHPSSSLIAVMIQAITHRVNYVWVIDNDYCLVGIVTFTNMLEVFRDHFQSMS